MLLLTGASIAGVISATHEASAPPRAGSSAPPASSPPCVTERRPQRRAPRTRAAAPRCDRPTSSRSCARPTSRAAAPATRTTRSRTSRSRSPTRARGRSRVAEHEPSDEDQPASRAHPAGQAARRSPRPTTSTTRCPKPARAQALERRREGRPRRRGAHRPPAGRGARPLRRRVEGRRHASRPARHPLRAAPGARHQDVEGLAAQGRPGLRAGRRPTCASSPRSPASRPSASRCPTGTARWSTWATSTRRRPKGWSPLTVWLGKDIAGKAIGTDLAKQPHILVAGTTGSGKSGCVNAMLSSILLRATPNEVRLVLVDPKQVELNLYESIPHLLTPVVTSPRLAANVLQNLIKEMEERYSLMSGARTRNIVELNRLRVARGRAAAALHPLRDRRAGRPDDGRARARSRTRSSAWPRSRAPWASTWCWPPSARAWTSSPA